MSERNPDSGQRVKEATAYFGVTVTLETIHLMAAAGWIEGDPANGWTLTEQGSGRVAGSLAREAAEYWSG